LHHPDEDARRSDAARAPSASSGWEDAGADGRCRHTHAGGGGVAASGAAPAAMEPPRCIPRSSTTSPEGMQAASALPPSSLSTGHSPDGTVGTPAEHEWTILTPETVPSGWELVESWTRHKPYCKKPRVFRSAWLCPRLICSRVPWQTSIGPLANRDGGILTATRRRQLRTLGEGTLPAAGGGRKGTRTVCGSSGPERHAEPAAPHSIATAWVGSTRRLALSLGDWLATLNVPAESMGDEDEGRLLATPPAAHAPPEAPLFCLVG